MKILHIDSSIQESNSVTRELSAAVVSAIRDRINETQTLHRDLIKNEICHLTRAIASGFREFDINLRDEIILREHQISEELVGEFLSSNTVVIGAPMYNFSIASQLKAWLDRIAQAGRTFKYTESGSVGLSGHKTVIIVSARGGFYAEGHAAKMDFQENYLSAFFGFLGIEDIRFIRAEGISRGDEQRKNSIAQAKLTISETLNNLNLIT